LLLGFTKEKVKIMQEENQSGYANNYTVAVDTVVPLEIKRWNWGAFMFNFIWGIGNKTYMPLFVLIPFFNIVWIFVCGAKGNEWAWKAGEYKSVEEFNMVQSTWNRAGLVSFIISVVSCILMILFSAVIGAAMYSMMPGWSNTL
jgi:hypothetical protein